MDFGVCSLNLLLYPIFLVVFGMLYLMMRDKLIRFVGKTAYSIRSIAMEIQRLSIPTVATQVLGPATLMFITFLLAKQSPMAVAAFGIAGRIEMVLMIGILSISTAITPFIAPNPGAQTSTRVGGSLGESVVGKNVCV